MNPAILARYSKQIALPEIGKAGQQYLADAKILCVGAGGLGSLSLMYLAAAGIGTIGIVESDQVDISNIHRQLLYNNNDIGKDKLACAIKVLSALNPHLIIKAYHTKFTASNASTIMRDFSVVIDGTDNFAAKFLINDCAAKLGIPMIYGSIFAFEGQVATFFAKQGACYRCLYPIPPANYVPNCATNGVLGPLVGIISSMQAMECIKLILALRGSSYFDLLSVINRLYVINGKNMHNNNYLIAKSATCTVCTKPPEQIVLSGHQVTGTSHDTCALQLVGASQVTGASHDKLNVQTNIKLNAQWQNITAAQLSGALAEFTIIDIREQHELYQGGIPDAMHLPLSGIMLNGKLSTNAINFFNNSQNFSGPTNSANISNAGGNAKVCIYCQHGVRSKFLLQQLQWHQELLKSGLNLNISNYFNLQGGYVAWFQLH